MGNRSRAPIVTAVIVVLNGERFIAEAIGSIVLQTFADWELLVIDDGSTNGTNQVVLNETALYPRQVVLLQHPDGGNHGIAASRNLAIAHARGRYIAFLDADDIWEPDKLTEQVDILEADPSVGLVYGRTLIWHSWAGPGAPDDFFYALGVEANRRYEPPKLFELLMKNKAQTPTTCNAMIRASVFGSLGGFDNGFRGMFEDLTFFAKLLATTPVYVSGQAWAKYRQHDRSCSAVSAAEGADRRKRLEFMNWLARSLPSAARRPRVLACLRHEQARAALALLLSAPSLSRKKRARG